MFATPWKTSRKRTARRSRPRPRSHPGLESLERRIVPAAGNLPPPVAHDDQFFTPENFRISVAGPGVLLNDTVTLNLPLTAVLQNGPAHGLLTFNQDGSFTYTPNLDFIGIDHFRYVARQALGEVQLTSNVADVTIVVYSGYHARADSYTTFEEGLLNVPAASGVLANDLFGAAGNVLPPPDTAAAPVPGQGPQHGTLTLNADGSFRYTPDPGFLGTDTFQYQDVPTGLPASPDPPGLSITRTPLGGGAASPFATVTISVVPDCGPLPLPVVQDWTLQDTQNFQLHVGGHGVLTNVSATWNTPLTAELVQPTAHGTVLLNPDGTFDYFPVANFTGVDRFTYDVRQFYHDQYDLISDTATVTINVAPAYHANPDLYHGDQDTDLNVPAGGGVLVNDRLGTQSPPTGTVAVLVNGQAPQNGQVKLNPDGSFVYTPNPGFFGTDTFQYQDVPATPGHPPSDPPGLSITRTPESGNTDSPIATVTVTVRPAVPLAPGFFFFVQQDTPLVVTADQGLLSDTTYGPNDGRLTASLFSAPTNGTVVINDDGSFTYTPNPGYTGNDSFQYQVFDNETEEFSGPGLVSLFVYASPQSFPAPPGQPPIAHDDSYRVNENNTLNVPPAGVLANDVLSSSESGKFDYAFVEDFPGSGTVNLNTDGSFTYTPSRDFTGLDHFTYRVWEWDGTNWTFSNTATVNITVAPFNFPPVASDHFYPATAGSTLTVRKEIGVLANDSDFENEPLTAVLVQGPHNGTVTLNPDGSFNYTPTSLSFRGDDTFTYLARDAHGQSGPATVHIHVRGQAAVATTGEPPAVATTGEPPVANPDVYLTTVNQPLTVTTDGVLVNDIDVDHEQMQAQLIDGPAHGKVTLNADGSFVYAPDADYAGLDVFTYRDLDNCGESNVTTVTIRVVPSPPVWPPSSIPTSILPVALLTSSPVTVPIPTVIGPVPRVTLPTPTVAPAVLTPAVSPQSSPSPNPEVPESVSLLNRGALDLALFAPDSPQLGPSPQRLPPQDTSALFGSQPVAIQLTRPVAIQLTRLVGGSSTYGEVSGRMFLDLNGTGINDPLKPGLPGRLVFLDLNNNGVHDDGEPIEMTNAKGEYIFRNVPPGKYYVRRLQFENMTQTAPAEEDGYEVRLPVGQVKLITELDFGLQPPPSRTIRPVGGVAKPAPEEAPPDDSPDDAPPDDGGGDSGDGGGED